MRRDLGWLGMVVGLVLGVSSAVEASTLTFAYGEEISGGDVPATGGGAPPWLVATFDDEDTAGSVSLDLQANLQGESEFITKVLFNLDPALDGLLTGSPAELTITKSNAQAMAATANVGLDAFNGGTGGRYDIQLGFPSSNSPGTDRFVNGDLAQFVFEGTDLTASDFAALDARNSDQREGYLSLAHVQGIGDAGEGSGWIAPSNNPGDDPPQVPVPGTLALLGAGLLGAGLQGRRRG